MFLDVNSQYLGIFAPPPSALLTYKMESSTVFCENGAFLKISSKCFELNTLIEDVVGYFHSQLLTRNLENSGYFSFNSGKPISSDISKVSLSNYTTSDSYLRLRWNVKCLGGKGGFGSMLRAQGGKMAKKKRGKKSENENDSFRTLEGRRMKNVRQAKELAAYLDKKKTKSDSAYQTKKEKLTAKISSDISGSAKFHDATHSEILQSLNEAVQNSVKDAFERNSSASSSRSSSSSRPSSSIEVSRDSNDGNSKIAPKKDLKGLSFFDDDSDDDLDSESDGSSAD